MRIYKILTKKLITKKIEILSILIILIIFSTSFQFQIQKFFYPCIKIHILHSSNRVEIPLFLLRG